MTNMNVTTKTRVVKNAWAPNIVGSWNNEKVERLANSYSVCWLRFCTITNLFNW